jgi:type IV pilus assembly protein PilW
MDGLLMAIIIMQRENGMKNHAVLCRGFTLIEVMVAVAVFGIISTAIYATYHNQQRIYLDQEKIVEMQQNVRAALFFIERDVRMMGYDPTEQTDAANASSTVANIAELRFAYDENSDGTLQSTEYIRYALKPVGGSSIIENGLAGGVRCCLARETGIGSSASGLQPVIDNVEALEFVYHLADGTTTTDCPTQSDRANIRSIDVSLLVRTSSLVHGYLDTKKYYPASNHDRSDTGTVWGPFNDGYRRRLLNSNIKCRNMGL